MKSNTLPYDRRNKNPQPIKYFEKRSQCKSSMLAALNTKGKTVIKAKFNHTELFSNFLKFQLKLQK